jgi:hypothetical protein
MQYNPTFEELKNSNIYKIVKMEDMIVSKNKDKNWNECVSSSIFSGVYEGKYIMLCHINNKVMYINVIENNEDYFEYEFLENRNRFSIPSYKNIFEQYFLFYKEINNRDVRELKFLSHLSSRYINVKKEFKINVLSSLDLVFEA